MNFTGFWFWNVDVDANSTSFAISLRVFLENNNNFFENWHIFSQNRDSFFKIRRVFFEIWQLLFLKIGEFLEKLELGHFSPNHRNLWKNHLFAFEILRIFFTSLKRRLLDFLKNNFRSEYFWPPCTTYINTLYYSKIGAIAGKQSAHAMNQWRQKNENRWRKRSKWAASLTIHAKTPYREPYESTIFVTFGSAKRFIFLSEGCRVTRSGDIMFSHCLTYHHH